MAFTDLFASIGTALSIRRRRTLAGRLQEAVERAAETVQEAYETAAETLGPVVARSASAAAKATERAREAYEEAAASAVPALERSRKAAAQATGRTITTMAPVMERSAGLAAAAAATAPQKAREILKTGRETAARGTQPVLARSSKAAAKALSRTAGATTAGAGTAAETARSGVAAVGAVAGFFAALGARLWSLTVFLVKTAILAGVAYAGWQWLQSRRESQLYGSTYQPASHPSSTYGSVAPAAPPIGAPS